MSDMIRKPTKKDNYNAILSLIDTMDAEGFVLDSEDITYTSLREFVNHEIELLNNKAVAAQKRAAAKKAEGDILRARIYDVLSAEEFMTITEVLKALNDEDVSAQMATARLTQLVELGQAEKDTVSMPSSTEGGRAKRLSAYRRLG